MLLADKAAENDRLVYQTGEPVDPANPDAGFSHAEHYRTDLDAALGLTGEPVDNATRAAEPVNDGDTNVIDLAQWISESNRVMTEYHNR